MQLMTQLIYEAKAKLPFALNQSLVVEVQLHNKHFELDATCALLSTYPQGLL